MKNATSATPPQQSTSQQPWWCQTDNHMALHDGKLPACPSWKNIPKTERNGSVKNIAKD